MLIYELLSEINPFLIFCWMLFKQILYFSRVARRNANLAMIDKYGLEPAGAQQDGNVTMVAQFGGSTISPQNNSADPRRLAS